MTVFQVQAECTSVNSLLGCLPMSYKTIPYKLSPINFLCYNFQADRLLSVGLSKVIVRSEKLYDPKNPSLIMCDPNLETALNVKDLHVTEVRHQILKHLTLVRHQNWRLNYNSCFIKRGDISIPPAKTSNVTTAQVPNKYFKYIVKPLLMGLLRSECDEKDRTKAAFKFDEVLSLLFKYLLRRRGTLFDSRNIKVARVHLDLLGTAVGGIVRFHRSQAEKLLKAQMSPAYPVFPPIQCRVR
jgi:hypothetical protein